MTAAFLSFSLMLLLLPSFLPGQDTPRETTLKKYALGVFAELNGDRQTARMNFEDAHQDDPQSFALACKTASLQKQTGDLSAAIRTLQQHARSYPQLLASQLHYVDFLKTHAPRDIATQSAALDILAQANERLPNHPEVYTRLIHLHENLGQRDRSLKVLHAQLSARNVDPEHWTSLQPLVRTLLPGGSQELQEALILVVEKMVATGIHLPLTARRASDYYRKESQLPEAIRILKRHVEMRPDSLELRIRLGLLQLYNGEETKAFQTLHTTLQIDPDQTLAHKALSQFYARDGQAEKSLHHRAEALRIAGGSSTDFLDLASQLLDSGNPRRARLILEKARFNHPANSSIAAQLAIVTLREGDAAKASRLFRQAENLARDSPPGTSPLGPIFQIEFASALRQTGNLSGAETRLQKAIPEIPPEDPTHAASGLRQLARLWIEQNRNMAPAASLLKRAETLDPKHPENSELLKRIPESSR